MPGLDSSSNQFDKVWILVFGPLIVYRVSRGGIDYSSNQFDNV